MCCGAETSFNLTCRNEKSGTSELSDPDTLRIIYTPTGCLLLTGTGVNHLKRSGFSPRTIAKNSF